MSKRNGVAANDIPRHEPPEGDYRIIVKVAYGLKVDRASYRDHRWVGAAYPPADIVGYEPIGDSALAGLPAC